MCVCLPLPLSVYICTMIIALDWHGYLHSCFVVMGAKDVRNPDWIAFSRLYRASEYIAVCKNLIWSSIFGVLTINFSE